MLDGGSGGPLPQMLVVNDEEAEEEVGPELEPPLLLLLKLLLLLGADDVVVLLEPVLAVALGPPAPTMLVLLVLPIGEFPFLPLAPSASSANWPP